MIKGINDNHNNNDKRNPIYNNLHTKKEITISNKGIYNRNI